MDLNMCGFFLLFYLKNISKFNEAQIQSSYFFSSTLCAKVLTQQYARIIHHRWASHGSAQHVMFGPRKQYACHKLYLHKHADMILNARTSNISGEKSRQVWTKWTERGQTCWDVSPLFRLASVWIYTFPVHVIIGSLNQNQNFAYMTQNNARHSSKRDHYTKLNMFSGKMLA